MLALLGHVAVLAAPVTFNVRWVLRAKLLTGGTGEESLNGRFRDMVQGYPRVFYKESSLRSPGGAGWTSFGEFPTNHLFLKSGPGPKLSGRCAVSASRLAHRPEAIGAV